MRPAACAAGLLSFLHPDPLPDPMIRSAHAVPMCMCMCCHWHPAGRAGRALARVVVQR